MKIITKALQVAELLHELDWFGDLLIQRGVKSLLVEYGWGCRLPTDQLWKDIPVAAEDLRGFVRSSEQEGVYVPGDSDLIIRDIAKSIEFMPCHEQHIHFSTQDDDLIVQVKRRWIDNGFYGSEVV